MKPSATLRSAALASLLALVPSLVASPARAQQAADPFLEAASRARAAGAEDAPVIVYELADFQCPYCGRFARELQPRLKREYVDTGKVRWIFVNYPLPMHARAWLAAEAALCAAGAGADFWRMHDRLFEAQAEWAGADDPAGRFAALAGEAGAEPAAYESCVRDDRVAQLLVQDLTSAVQTGATGTPAFVVNQELIVGVRPYEEWKTLLDGAAEEAASSPGGG